MTNVDLKISYITHQLHRIETKEHYDTANAATAFSVVVVLFLSALVQHQYHKV